MNGHIIILWILGALSLIALAGVAPNVAIWISVLLILLVLLKNAQVYLQYLGAPKQTETAKPVTPK